MTRAVNVSSEKLSLGQQRHKELHTGCGWCAWMIGHGHDYHGAVGLPVMCADKPLGHQAQWMKAKKNCKAIKPGNTRSWVKQRKPIENINMHIENGLDNINLSGDMIEVGGGRPTSLVGGRFHCLTKWPAGNLKSICHWKGIEPNQPYGLHREKLLLFIYRAVLQLLNYRCTLRGSFFRKGKLNKRNH